MLPSTAAWKSSACPRRTSSPRSIASISTRRARVIETNSFGANPARLARHGLEGRARELNATAVRLAQRAAAGRDGVYIAGSVGPLGFTPDEARERGIDRRDAYREQISALLDAGVDLIFFETFLDLDEILLALEVQRGLATGTPALCSLACSEEGRLPGGATITEAFARLREAGAAIVGVNCLNGPQADAQAARTHPARVGPTPFRLSERRIPEVPRRAVPVLHGPGVFRQGGEGNGRAGGASGRRLLRDGAVAGRRDGGGVA